MDAATHAIADPVRRDILAMLRDGDLTAGQIAARFDISRPAISRHLRVLRAAGLAVDEPAGRRRVYRLDAGPLGEVENWIGSLRTSVGAVGGGGRPWGGRLDALETEVRRTRRDRERLPRGSRRDATKEAG